MTEEKAKSLIGRKVRGFKYESSSPIYSRSMDEFIGKIGVIDSMTRFGNFIIKFNDCNKWAYPASLIETHLVEESVSRKITDFKESETTTESDLIEILPKNENSLGSINVIDLINQNEQLKADKEDVLGLLEAYIFELDNGQFEFFNKYGFNISELSNKFRQTLEKHGK